MTRVASLAPFPSSVRIFIENVEQDAASSYFIRAHVRHCYFNSIWTVRVSGYFDFQILARQNPAAMTLLVHRFGVAVRGIVPRLIANFAGQRRIEVRISIGSADRRDGPSSECIGYRGSLRLVSFRRSRPGLVTTSIPVSTDTDAIGVRKSPLRFVESPRAWLRLFHEYMSKNRILAIISRPGLFLPDGKSTAER